MEGAAEPGVAKSSSPFGRYPGGGQKLLGSPPDWSNCRSGYGLDLARVTGVTTCAYCGLDLTETFNQWLLMSVDHVIPKSEGTRLGIEPAYINDMFNLVLACAGCNAFKNRYQLPGELAAGLDLRTPQGFVSLRDQVFAARARLIAERRALEMAEYERRRWAKPLSPPIERPRRRVIVGPAAAGAGPGPSATTD
ncbi:MAG: endonuclease [Chloroflexi bacterium]|nr:endonuclease [Chloroflexota bacterium]